jgi:hypothetical protein
MPEVSMMWVGNPLTQVQRLSMRSFLHHGFDVVLYCYDDLNPPAGVTVRDANTIVRDTDIFESHQTFAAFADLFRYRLLQTSDTLWVDADTVCLRPDWDFGDYIFGRQETGKLNNGVLGYPKESCLAHTMVKRAKYHGSNVFDALGPILLTEVADELELSHMAQPEQTFSPVRWQDFRLMWQEADRDQVLATVENSHAVSLWNYQLGFHNYPRNDFPANTAMAYWEAKFTE